MVDAKYCYTKNGLFVYFEILVSTCQHEQSTHQIINPS